MKGAISAGVLLLVGLLILASSQHNLFTSGQCTPGDTTWVWEKTCYGDPDCKACCESDGSMEKHGWVLDYCELTFTDLDNPSISWTERKSPGYTPCAWSTDYKIKVVNYYKCGGEQCEAHDHKACYNNDVYWYDSCNRREDKWRECGDGRCVESGNDAYCENNPSCEHKLLDKYCSAYDPDNYRVELWQKEDCSTYTLKYKCPSGTRCVDGECVPGGGGSCESIEEFPGEYGGVNVIKGRIEFFRYFLAPKSGVPTYFPDDYVSSFKECCESLGGKYGYKEHFGVKTSVYCDLSPFAKAIRLLKQYWYIAAGILFLFLFMGRGRQQVIVMPARRR